MKVFAAVLSVLISCSVQRDHQQPQGLPSQCERFEPSEALLRRTTFIPNFLPAALASEPERDPCRSSDGRRPLRGRIDPRVIYAAGEQLNLPMGTGRELSVRGRRYIFCLEPHYHAVGSGAGPEGWHKGVTVYEAG